ncbi:hypothetical protein K8089_05095 [Aequorivita sp. F47161]|uniref:Uncharacterized protein n=1 Tax=Aequorivita vitellina TaxID=2874475 RepID=A0A9X1QS67_9FLAO|nr:hypothetical protein [Aequorivita vitellina]MCG2418391.1 hypothetical protein [Aequorivita vitellina]
MIRNLLEEMLHKSTPARTHQIENLRVFSEVGEKKQLFIAMVGNEFFYS